MPEYKNRKSIPLKNRDYSSNGYYFITICTKNMENYFGKIINSEVILSDIGKVAYKYWLEIPNHFKNTKIDEFVIIPNHIQGIIIIDNKDLSIIQTNDFSKPIKNSLSVIINQYKGSVKRYCNKNNIIFQWLPQIL